MNTIHKPDSEALLAEVLREEGSKGRLKIFLGYAPGVGKTYKMLEQAKDLKERGIDVVVGLVETHGREETEALLEGLEIIPRKKIPYKNVVLKELDLNAILKRKPDAVLVDELAHTNAPGSQHERRYQDAQTLIEEGIDVYTTVNIQHFESLNDTVAQITGVRVHETVPDFILDRADEVDVVDIPLEELHQRLEEGKVYAPDLTKTALEKFFKRGNLLALRELTLRRVASKLDQELIEYMKARGIAGPWATSERLCVCVGTSPFSPQLIRKAYQMARELKAEWYAVYVETPAHLTLGEKERANLSDAMNLARQLGAKVVMLTGQDVSKEILGFADQEKISKMVLGKPIGSFIRRAFSRYSIYDVVRKAGAFDIYFITPQREKISHGISSPRKIRTFVPWKNYALSVLTILPVTAIAAILFYWFNVRSLVILFVLAPMASAFFFGIGPSLFVSVLAAIIYDFLFTEPYFSLRIADPAIILEIAVFIATSVATGQLAKLVRRQQEALSKRLGRMEILTDMGRELLSIPNIEQLVVKSAVKVDKNVHSTLDLMRVTVEEAIASTVLRYISRALHWPCVVIIKEVHKTPRIWAKSDEKLSLTPKEETIIQWVYEQNEPAGKGTGTLEGAEYFFYPFSSRIGCMGVIGMRQDFGLLLPDERDLILAIANFAAVALENLETQTGEIPAKPHRS
jgi:two-component system sensor histidine kinase KdpD